LQAILARNRFDGAILVVDGLPFPETGPHIAGILVRDNCADGHSLDSLQRDSRFRGLCASFSHGAPTTAEELARRDLVLSVVQDTDLRIPIAAEELARRGLTLPIVQDNDLRIPAAAVELARRGLTLDVEMQPADFPALVQLAERLPTLRMAIDHLARPAFHLGPTDEWLHGMESAARLPNVVCKISGLLAEVTLPWKAEPIRPFVQHALAVFGPRRLMFGSEWPARLPDVTWKESLAAFTQSIGAHTMEVREQLLGGTAAEFYRL
jgi:hypothetical protein